MKWHHYAGLLFGVVTLTWTYSGLLSMGPFNWFAAPPPPREQRDAVTGGPLPVDRLSLESLRAAIDTIAPAFAPKELDAVQFRGEAYWMALHAPAAADAIRWTGAAFLPRTPAPRLERRYVSVTHPESGAIAAFERGALEEAARAAMPRVRIVDAAWLEAYDAYYYDARGSRALPVLRVRYDDPLETWLYLDPERGAVALRTVRTTRRLRWLYHGLHSFDFPAIYYRRPLWDIVVIALSLGGLLLSAVSIVPAWRRLRRHARHARLRVRAARTLGAGGRA
jgi:hypothetical protein